MALRDSESCVAGPVHPDLISIRLAIFYIPNKRLHHHHHLLLLVLLLSSSSLADPPYTERQGDGGYAAGYRANTDSELGTFKERETERRRERLKKLQPTPTHSSAHSRKERQRDIERHTQVTAKADSELRSFAGTALSNIMIQSRAGSSPP